MNAIESGLRLERTHIGSEQCLAFFTDDCLGAGQVIYEPHFPDQSQARPGAMSFETKISLGPGFSTTRQKISLGISATYSLSNETITASSKTSVTVPCKKNEFQREQQPARVQTLAQLSPSRLPQLPMQLEVRFQRTADVSCTRSRINGDSAQAGEGNCTYLVVCTVFTAYFHRQIVHLARLLFQVVHFERLEYASYEDSKIQAVLTRTHSHDRQCIG